MGKLWMQCTEGNNGEDNVIFVTDDKSAFRNNTEYLQKEFHEVTGKTIEIHPNSYYKELLKQPEKSTPESTPEKKAEEISKENCG